VGLKDQLRKLNDTVTRIKAVIQDAEVNVSLACSFSWLLLYLYKYNNLINKYLIYF
jgi:hypothetical protein